MFFTYREFSFINICLEFVIFISKFRRKIVLSLSLTKALNIVVPAVDLAAIYLCTFGCAAWTTSLCGVSLQLSHTESAAAR